MRIIILLFFFGACSAYAEESYFANWLSGGQEQTPKLLQCSKKPEIVPVDEAVNNMLYSTSVANIMLAEQPGGLLMLPRAVIPSSLEQSTAQPSMLGNTAREADPKEVEQPKEYPFGMFSVYDNDMVEGDSKAKIVVVEYSAPTCPHCAYYNKEVYPKIKARYIDTKKIAYVIREFVANKQDLEASLLLRCANQHIRDRLEKLRSVIYQQQESWAYNKNHQGILTNIGQLAGVNEEQYKVCLEDGALTELLAANARAIAMYKGFIGTPAFFINGVMHKGPYTAEAISKAIEGASKAIAADKVPQ